MNTAIGYYAALAAMVLYGCAGSGPAAKSPFQLVAGKKVGTLEMVAEESSGGAKKSRDSAQFDQKYLHAKPRIGFRSSREDIVFMKVYQDGKPIQTCDETSYTRTIVKGGPGGEILAFGPDGKATRMMTPGSSDEETYSSKYKLECELGELKDGMTVELEDGDGMVSRYRWAAPAGQP
jgi:hypothetical protein